MPLLDLKQIEKRQGVVNTYYRSIDLLENTRDHLAEINDLERLAVKLSTGKILPKELLQLKEGIVLSNEIKELGTAAEGVLKDLCDTLWTGLDFIATITDRLKEEPSNNFNKGEVMRQGFSTDLDDLRELLYHGKDKLLDIQRRESQATGIANLKIAFNNVFGYFLEVRNSQKDKVPEEWIRKQTLVNAERYITPELKEYEAKILGAEEKIVSLEQGLYEDLLEECRKSLAKIQTNGRLIAQIDCLSAFAELAKKQNYHLPSLNEGTAITIEEGRHPVIEQSLASGKEYIANSLDLNRDQQQLLMITGPNMSGKSALLRQTALICLLAQMGSFVPASAAELGLVDKIFVRVGASDNISQGESTFMVEMNETASILNNLSERSLVVLDEIGRGTSTYDGISIAWSIAEFLHEHPSRAKTLFATHYHELNEMANLFERVHNYNVSVKEVGDKIIFMRKLRPGGSAHSFGIHVAKMAGMPNLVLNRAEKILAELESSRAKGKDTSTAIKKAKDDMQLSFFNLDDPILEDIRIDIQNLDINTLTPVEALMKLNEIKKKIGL